ncbi:MAG: hypothetical protein JSU95_03265 [Betaproteobacteria bacterium]|nr:MAG: hypothetical protein JSU95_03265 [Betaproteobacteria bacterium]
MSSQTPTPMQMCPMAETCGAMMSKPFSRTTLLLPGLIFIALGFLVVIYPLVLVWLVAVAFVFVGIMMLVMATFIRKIGTRLGS